MADENAMTNEEVRQALLDDPSSQSEYTGATAPDTIKGWNDRRRSNNQVISGLVPFVQLIGLFNAAEYERLFSTNALKTREITFTDVGGRDIPINTPYISPNLANDTANLNEWIRTKLANRFIKVYMVQQIESGLSVEPVDGIIMASSGGLPTSVDQFGVGAQSQAVDPSGGVGITDLQVDYGKSNILGSRKFVIRMTINDPTYLNTHPEYAKLATMQSDFLIIYGWANPQSIPGYSAAVAPPLLEQDPHHAEHKMLVVPMKNLGNGGYWSAGKVNINAYDFSFNPMGQLEITATLRDLATVGLISTRLSSIAPLFNKLMGTGETTEDKNFINMLITNSNGNQITIKDKVLEEQLKLMNDADLTEAQREAKIASLGGVGSQVEISSLGALNEPVSTVMENWTVNNLSYYENANAASNISSYEQKRQSESMGFPNALGISTYEKYDRHITLPAGAINPETGLAVSAVDEDPSSDDNDENIPSTEDEVAHLTIKDYRVKTVYYYLGWVMEGIRLSLSDSNRGRQIEGEPIFNPKFFYTDNSNDSQLTAAFQKTIPPSNRRSSIEERIQEAIVRLKEKCMPPAPRLQGLSRRQMRAIVETEAAYGIDLTEYPNQVVLPCGGVPVVAGKPTKLQQDIVKAIFIIPPSAQEMADVPHRGFLITINPRDSQYSTALSEAVTAGKLDSGWSASLPMPLEDDPYLGTITLFKPDWYVEIAPVDQIDITEVVKVGLGRVGGHQQPVPAGGSPKGYDPNNPEEYQSRTRGGRFYYLVQHGPPFVAKLLGGHLGRVVSRARDALTTMTNENAINILMTVNEYRTSNQEIWELTQRRWHNIYIRFLHVYFERLIRARIQELTEEGREVEEIYDEPVDLDFLTGKVFNNNIFKSTSVTIAHGGSHRTGNAALAATVGFVAAGPVGALFGAVVGGGTAPNKYAVPTWQLGAHSPKPDQELIDFINKFPARISELNARERLLILEMNKLVEQSQQFVPTLNDIRDRIEGICGGKYEREQPLRSGMKGLPAGPADIFGNRVLSNFKNWEYVVHGNKNNDRSGVQRLPGVGDRGMGPSYDIDVWYPLVFYKPGNPKVSMDFILWNNFNFSEPVPLGSTKIPTNNFNWADYADVPSNRRYGDEDGTSHDATRVGEPVDRDNLQSLWIEQNPAQYEEAKKTKDEREAELLIQLGLESVQVKKLNGLYIEYQNYQRAIENINDTITEANNLEREYSALQRDGKIKELSPYADTSDIDTTISIDMGRDKPMVLTTKVAWQFYNRFRTTRRAGDVAGLMINGTNDVMNYGPPPGGLQYFKPTNIRKFVFRPERAGDMVTTLPQMILDPEQLQLPHSRNLLFALDIGVPTGEKSVENGLSAGTYDGDSDDHPRWMHWGAFGTPGTPDEEGRNEYGFKLGPPHALDADGSIGGTNVSNYGEFLDLFGLEYDPKLPGMSKITGSWPSAAGAKIPGTDEDLLYYNMIDENNNILMPDGEGWFITSGWVLEYGGDPVFLYPDIDHAVRINTDVNDKENVGTVIETGYGSAAPGYGTKAHAETPFYWKDNAEEHRPRNAIGVGQRVGPTGIWGQGGNEDNDNGNRNWMIPIGYSGTNSMWSEGKKGGREEQGDKVANPSWSAAGGWVDVANGIEIERRNKIKAAIRGAAAGAVTGGALPGIGLVTGALAGAAMGFIGFGKARGQSKKPVTIYTNENGQSYSPNGIAGWGPRIGSNEHNPNLTLDEKRSLVIRRGSARVDFFTLGRDMPAPWASLDAGNSDVPSYNALVGPALTTDRTQANWSVIDKKDDGFYYYSKDWDGHKEGEQLIYNDYEIIPGTLPVYEPESKAVFRTGEDGLTEEIEPYQEAKLIKPATSSQRVPIASSGVVEWPQMPKYRGFSNKDYPYGTGYYKNRSTPPGETDGDKSKEWGAWAFPEKKPTKNYMYWADFLLGLPGSGFFTNVNNDDYSPTKILPDGTIVDGEELNEGLVQFIIQNVIAPLPKNRRIATRQGLKAPRVINSKNPLDEHKEWRTYDVCYGDLFAPIPDEESKPGKKDISFADLTDLKIDNVADMPIRRDVVDNLMNKNNNSMSIASFFSEIFKPKSIGIQSANVNIGARQRGDGTFEIFQANKNWDRVARQMMDEYDELTQNLPDRYPPNFILFDYKSTDSLIQNIDMTSKFDPMIGLTFEQGAEAWTGDEDKFAKFLAYGNVAQDLQEFLEAEKNPDYEDIVTVDDKGTESVKVDLRKLLGDAEGNKRVVPQSVLTKFLMLRPERMQKLNALIQSTPGSNFATQLLAQYMRKTTITIHGTTNLFPFQKILIRGIVPNLEGLYLITNTRESIMPQDFQTIIDAVLIKPVSEVKTIEEAEEARGAPRAGR